VQGEVLLNLLVDEKGSVTRADVLRGNELLRQAAVSAVRSWKYQPALLNGQPVPTQVEVQISFRLP
jgi:TonB family protein